MPAPRLLLGPHHPFSSRPRAAFFPASLPHPAQPRYWLPVQDIRIGSGISLALPRILLTKGGTGAGLGALCVSRMGRGYRKGPERQRTLLLTQVRLIGCLCFQESSGGRPYRVACSWFGTSCKVSTHSQVPLSLPGSGGWEAGGRQSHQVQQQGLRVPLPPRLQSPSASPETLTSTGRARSPDRGTESTGMSARWEEGAARPDSGWEDDRAP